MPVAIDVPDHHSLARELSTMDRRLRVDRPESPLEIRDGLRAVFDEHRRIRREHAVRGGVHDQRWIHELRLLAWQCRG